MSLELEEVKKYLRVDTDDEDDTIQHLIEFSREEIENSTGDDGKNPSKSYKMAQLLIIADRFETRTSEEEEQRTNTVLDKLLLKIKMGVAKNVTRK